MRRKWLKGALWVLLTPIVLFVILMILLYVPPVQNFIRKQATAIASDATGMNISVERIDLRFPLNLLVRGVQVVQSEADAADVQHPDTLLNLGSLNVSVQAWPLLQGRVEVNAITLQQVAVNSSNLLEGMHIKGTLGRFSLESHGIDLKKEEPGLLSLAESWHLLFETFTEEELKAVKGEFTPSKFVKKITGVDNVCERSAVLASGQGTLIRKKTGRDGVTTALAAGNRRIHFE